MSQLGAIEGAAHLFERNRITAWQVKGLELERAEAFLRAMGLAAPQQPGAGAWPRRGSNPAGRRPPPACMLRW